MKTDKTGSWPNQLISVDVAGRFYINNIMKLLIIFLVIALSGCSGMQYERSKGKVYITSDEMPTITNDKAYGTQKPGSQQRILVNGRITYQFIYTFR